ncbi:MAG TPA: hypothetical protein VFC84_06010 [Desulfosporosinus sp.]|nr:hypothetical protein [Desulfosporosinus sp.]
MKKNLSPDKNPNPNTKSTPFNPKDQPTMDSRDGHGLSKDEALRSKK